MLAYEPMIAVEMAAGRPDEADIVRYVIPFLSDIGIVAGVLWAVSAYGFPKRSVGPGKRPSPPTSLSLLTGFFSMIPAMSRGLFPLFLIVFLPNLITYILLLTYRPQSGWQDHPGQLAFWHDLCDGIYERRGQHRQNHPR